MLTVHTVLVLGLGLLLTVVRCPDATAQQIRKATLADVPLMVQVGGRQDARPSAPDEDTRHLTTLLEHPETLALVRETEGRVTGGVVATRHSVPGAAPQESISIIAWLQVAEEPAGTAG